MLIKHFSGALPAGAQLTTGNFGQLGGAASSHRESAARGRIETGAPLPLADAAQRLRGRPGRPRKHPERGHATVTSPVQVRAVPRLEARPSDATSDVLPRLLGVGTHLGTPHACSGAEARGSAGAAGLDQYPPLGLAGDQPGDPSFITSELLIVGNEGPASDPTPGNIACRATPTWPRSGPDIQRAPSAADPPPGGGLPGRVLLDGADLGGCRQASGRPPAWGRAPGARGAR
jgi:hypothetical protein